MKDGGLLIPNLAYNRSARRERQTVNQLRAEGWIAARTAGSKSPVDVFAYHPKLKKLLMIQIKTTKGHSEYTDTAHWMHSDVLAKFIWRKYG